MMKYNKLFFFAVQNIFLTIIFYILMDFIKLWKYNSSKVNSPHFSFNAKPLYPFISGNDFLLYSDFVLDEYVNNLNPISKIKNGDIIFVKTDLIGKFFRHYFTKLKVKIVLITHNSDFSPPKNYIKYLNSDNLIAWFTQNPCFSHNKLIPIPIGIENTVWFPAKEGFIRNVNFSNLIPWNERKYFLYINFNSKTNQNAREYLLTYYKNNLKGLLILNERVNYTTYMNQIGNSKYVLCPKGYGLDTHRFYETILMGSIPIVENSTLFPIYNEATVLVLNDYKNLEQTMLEKPELFIKNMNFSRNILLADTWFNRIDFFKTKLK